MANLLLGVGIVILLFGTVTLYYLFKSIATKSLLPTRGKTPKPLHRADNPKLYWAGIIMYGIIFFIIILMGGNVVRMGMQKNGFPASPVPAAGNISTVTVIIALILFAFSWFSLSSMYLNYKRGYIFMRRVMRRMIYREREPVLYWFFLGIYSLMGIFFLLLGLRVLGLV